MGNGIDTWNTITAFFKHVKVNKAWSKIIVFFILSFAAADCVYNLNTGSDVGSFISEGRSTTRPGLENDEFFFTMDFCAYVLLLIACASGITYIFSKNA